MEPRRISAGRSSPQGHSRSASAEDISDATGLRIPHRGSRPRPWTPTCITPEHAALRTGRSISTAAWSRGPATAARSTGSPTRANGDGARLAGPSVIPWLWDATQKVWDYFYPNDQSARLMWYHDHALGLTRLNAYAGVATGYIVQDDSTARRRRAQDSSSHSATRSFSRTRCSGIPPATQITPDASGPGCAARRPLVPVALRLRRSGRSRRAGFLRSRRRYRSSSATPCSPTAVVYPFHHVEQGRTASAFSTPAMRVSST